MASFRPQPSPLAGRPATTAATKTLITTEIFHSGTRTLTCSDGASKCQHLTSKWTPPPDTAALMTTARPRPSTLATSTTASPIFLPPISQPPTRALAWASPTANLDTLRRPGSIMPRVVVGIVVVLSIFIFVPLSYLVLRKVTKSKTR